MAVLTSSYQIPFPTPINTYGVGHQNPTYSPTYPLYVPPSPQHANQTYGKTCPVLPDLGMNHYAQPGYGQGVVPQALGSYALQVPYHRPPPHPPPLHRQNGYYHMGEFVNCDPIRSYGQFGAASQHVCGASNTPSYGSSNMMVFGAASNTQIGGNQHLENYGQCGRISQFGAYGQQEKMPQFGGNAIGNMNASYYAYSIYPNGVIENWLMNQFITGLKEEIKVRVLLSKPSSFVEAACYARIQEEILAKNISWIVQNENIKTEVASSTHVTLEEESYAGLEDTSKGRTDSKGVMEGKTVKIIIDTEEIITVVSSIISSHTEEEINKSDDGSDKIFLHIRCGKEDEMFGYPNLSLKDLLQNDIKEAHLVNEKAFKFASIVKQKLALVLKGLILASGDLKRTLTEQPIFIWDPGGICWGSGCLVLEHISSIGQTRPCGQGLLKGEELLCTHFLLPKVAGLLLRLGICVAWELSFEQDGITW